MHLTILETESSEIPNVNIESLLASTLLTADKNDLRKAVKPDRVEVFAADTSAFCIGENFDDVCIKRCNGSSQECSETMRAME